MVDRSNISAHNLTVRKGRMTVLDELDFTVAPGVITGLIGPSGSGKTTLLRTIVGVQKISAGTLNVLGKPAGDRTLRSRIGYVTQSPAIYGDLTVGQNLRYFGTLARASKGDIEKLIAVVRLEDKRNELVDRLSGGQKARVSLAVALLGNPDILVLDEPTVGLDPLLRLELWQLFAQLAAEGKMLIVSSHVMDEAEKCDQLLLMRGGRLLWHDSRIELMKRTKTKSVEAAFLKMVTTSEESI